MLCPFCKEEIADGAIKCKHCGSMLVSTQTQGAHLNQPQSIPDIISQVDVSEGVRKRFNFFYENPPVRRFGIAQVKGFDQLLKVFNVWAFLFTVFYYLIKGMWKKAISLFGVSIAMGAILGWLNVSEQVFWFFQFFYMGIVGSFAYYDLYRKLVLKEDYWW